MSTNEKKHPQGYWIAVDIFTRRIIDGQTLTADGGTEMVELK